MNISSLTNAARHDEPVNLFEYSTLFNTFSTHTVMNAVAGTKWSVPYLKATETLTDWCTTASGTMTANEAVLDAIGVQLAVSYCEVDMAALLTDAAARAARAEGATELSVILEEQKRAYARAVDNLLIAGKKSASSNNKLDGIVTLIKAKGTKVEKLQLTDMKAIIDKLVANIPDLAYEMGGNVSILMSKGNFALLKQALMAVNSNYMPNSTDSFKFNYPGFDMIDILGLDFMGDDIVATPNRNVVLLNNVKEDSNVEWVYDVASDKYIGRVKGVVGVSIFDATVTRYIG